MLFLGCDSGATKVDLIVVRDDGQVLACLRFAGVSPITDGTDGYGAAMQSYVRQTLAAARCGAAEVTCAAFGLTGYGESRSSVADAQAAFSQALGRTPCLLNNDSVTGWSGAMRCMPGICVASGTGAVAYGEDGKGNAGRAGGWSILYADEGSAYWVAVEAFKAFFRQADGRMEKTMLYDFFMDFFHADDPLFLCADIPAYAPDGDYARVAGFQRQVLELFKRGDPCARDIYRRAAHALCQLAIALRDRLDFPKDRPVPVTYAGGLFRAGACILEPFERCVRDMGGELVHPAFGPLAGAVGCAARASLSSSALDQLMEQAELASAALSIHHQK